MTRLPAERQSSSPQNMAPSRRHNLPPAAPVRSELPDLICRPAGRGRRGTSTQPELAWMVASIINAVLAEPARDRTEERNTYAKEVMMDIEAQRREAK